MTGTTTSRRRAAIAAPAVSALVAVSLLAGALAVELSGGSRAVAADGPVRDPQSRVVDLVFRVVDVNGASKVTRTGGDITIDLSTDVLFAFGSSQLAISGIAEVTRVAAELGTIKGGTLQIDGYTDSVGTDAVNVPLSQHRAQSVASVIEPLLASTGVTFDVKGFGPADPVAPNTLPGGADNPAGRAQNRRVTLRYVPAGQPSASSAVPTGSPGQPAASP